MARPTTRGLGFGVIIICLYFFAGQTQVGWLYVMVAGGLGWLILSYALPLWAVRGVAVRRHIMAGSAEPAVEDEPVEVQLTVRHPGRTTRRFLRLVESCPVDPPGTPPRSLVIDRLPAGRHLTLTYAPTCYLRGVYEWPAVRVESAGPLGLFVAARWTGPGTRLVVLPPAWRIDAPVGGARHDPAPARQPVRGQGLDVFGTRPYSHGDPVHAIHWRSTARHRELVVREFEEPRRPDIVVWIDNGTVFGSGRESSLEYAVKLATAVGLWAFRSGCRVLLVQRGCLTPCESALHLRRSLAHLAVSDGSWPRSGEMRSALAGVILQAEGSSGAAPDTGSHSGNVTAVRLTGFPDQPTGLSESGSLVVRPGSDLPREAATIARVLAGQAVLIRAAR